MVILILIYTVMIIWASVFAAGYLNGRAVQIEAG